MFRYPQRLMYLSIILKVIDGAPPSAIFTSSLAERAAASEITLMAEANSLLIQWANSRSSSRSSGGDRLDDATSINWLMFHLTELANTAYKSATLDA